jgi:hypothetical protein
MTPTEREAVIAECAKIVDKTSQEFGQNSSSAIAIRKAAADIRDLASAPADQSVTERAAVVAELFKFQIGATVLKYRGSYKLSGTIKAHFFTSGGAPRYVVDHEPTVPGLLHIYNEDQLTDDLASAPSEAVGRGEDERRDGHAALTLIRENL